MIEYDLRAMSIKYDQIQRTIYKEARDKEMAHRDWEEVKEKLNALLKLVES